MYGWRSETRLESKRFQGPNPKGLGLFVFNEEFSLRTSKKVMRSTAKREMSRFKSWVSQPGFELLPIRLPGRTAEHDSLSSDSNLEEVVRMLS